MRPATQIAKGHFNKPIDAVEVGVYQGHNALSILQNLPVKKIYLIDPYTVYFENSSDMGRTEGFPENEFIARDKLKDYDDKCEWIKKRSDEVELPPVDFVYLDGSHEYENVWKDLVYFYEILWDGGILAGHDWYSPSVQKAVVEFCKKMGLSYQKKKPDWIIYK